MANIPRFMRLHLLAMSLGVLLMPGNHLPAKPVVSGANDLPRVAWRFRGNVVELLNDEGQLGKYLQNLRAEVERRLEEYDIRDKETVCGYEQTLRNLDFLEGNYHIALVRTYKVRDLMDKPAEKLTSGQSMEALIEVYTAEPPVPPEKLGEAFAAAYARRIRRLPWGVVQGQIEEMNSALKHVSETFYTERLHRTLQKSVDRTGVLTMADLSSLASIRLMVEHMLPLKEEILAVTGSCIARNREEKPDIWAERYVDLSDEPDLTPVVVAISDSGVDADIYSETGQMWRNAGEVPGDGIDNDQNGFIDDVHGPAWDLESRRTTGWLYPLTRAQKAEFPAQLDSIKGLNDLNADIDSEEAAGVRGRMSSLRQEAYEDFLETTGLYLNYTHGTHVAGIAADGNPAARLLSARFTFNHEAVPGRPTIEDNLRSARELQAMVDYFKEAGVRVVNMSWGGSQSNTEFALEINGVGDNPEQRAEIARELFDITYDALVEAMASAPEILFIPAAGYSDDEMEFSKVIPGSIDLPNVLVVGAVDQAGEETGFTSYGENIRVHADGVEVESYVPGGRRMKFSGTSMSAPNVTNLAAKLIAIDPSLTPEEVIDLILRGADTTRDGRRHLINPRKSVDLLKLGRMDLTHQ